MPELPEVHTVIENLKKTKLISNKVVNVVVYREKTLKNCTEKEFREFMIGQKPVSFERIGKTIVIHLSGEKVLAIHLRMEGKLFYVKKGSEIGEKHLMIKIEFQNGDALLFYDTRMFGTFHTYSKSNYLKSKELSKIAIDPLDKKFTFQFLKKQLAKTGRAIKPVLLDQTVVSGIGNIYADEILFAAKIHPKTSTKKLSDLDIKNLVKFAPIILNESIQNKGTTIFSYQFAKDESGHFQKMLKIHGSKKKKCPVCGKKVTKIVVGGRGTYYCTICQVEK